MEKHDVIVMGGGPAGTACGNFLARAGVKVVVLEGEQHPRHHIGESLLAASMPILGRLGVSMGEMAEKYQPKYGARFYDPVVDRMETFAFEVPPGMGAPSYQVLRSAFDEMMVEKARAAGCDVRERAKVEWFDEEGRRPRVRLKGGEILEGRMLVDATGREPVIAKKRGTRWLVGEFGRVAVYNYFRDLPKHDEKDPDYITMYLFDGGWVWLIPLRDGRTSVGVVYRDVPMVATEGAGATKAEALFWHAVKTMPRLERRLRAAVATDEYRGAGDYSYTVSEKFGGHAEGGFVAVGDAAGFLDPIFSSGVHLALSSAERASMAIVEKLTTGSEVGLRDYAAFIDEGYHVFRAFVTRFYSRDLVRNLFFMENKPPEMHAAITRILAGEVWDRSNPVLKMICGENGRGPMQKVKPSVQGVALEGA